VPKHSYTYKALNRAVGKALHKYNMISDGDRIAVGLSGGKDSLALMEILSERRAYVPIRYEVIALHIDLGFEGGFSEPLEAYCEKKGYDLKVEYTDYGLIGHGAENKENPCFLCSRLRRKRLFQLADEYGCNKIALGHNKDDIIETLFINMCYAGEISTMVPAQRMFQNRLTVIRPLAYAEAGVIQRFASERRFPEFINPCPTASVSKRSEIRDLLSRLYSSNRKIKGNIFRALSHVRYEYLLKP